MTQPKNVRSVSVYCAECGSNPIKGFVLGDSILCHAHAGRAFYRDCPECMGHKKFFVPSPEPDAYCGGCNGTGMVMTMDPAKVRFKIIEVEFA